MHTTLFPTLLQAGTLPVELIAAVEAACWMIEDGDHAGHSWCEDKGYPGYTSYASLNDLPQRHPAFADLRSYLDAEAARMATALDWSLGSSRLSCDSLWVNILGEGGQHSGHIHPNSVLSGTCYIAMPPGAGSIKFEDPRLPYMMAAPQLSDNARHPRFHYETPKAGTILIWESWLRHEVMINQSQDPRISISFNYSLAD